MNQMDTTAVKPRSKTQFQKGENVRIIDGPFLGFNGIVDEVHQEHSKVKVLVSIFGRSTPVELGFLQVEKA
jgi:transcriptional antiterminator NusG